MGIKRYIKAGLKKRGRWGVVKGRGAGGEVIDGSRCVIHHASDIIIYIERKSSQCANPRFARPANVPDSVATILIIHRDVKGYHIVMQLFVVEKMCHEIF